MRLELQSIDIREVRFGPETKAAGHVLTVSRDELEGILLKEPRIRAVNLDWVEPGEKVRLVNLVDIIQPRCKADREDEDFPGWLGRMAAAGQGRTRSLRGVAASLSNSASLRPYSSLIDMFGIGSEMSRFAGMKILSVHPLPAEGTGERDFEAAVKIAGLRAAVYLARAAGAHPPDETEILDLSLPPAKGPDLPRVAYYYQLHTPQHDYQGIGDPILYGTGVTDLLPTIIHPNEILDGAIVSTHTLRGLETYAIQNHAVIRELYRRHGKDLLFAGVVIGVASIDPVQRQRMSMMAANLIAYTLKADGAILTKAHGGMPHVDLALVGEGCEARGVKTILFIESFQKVGTLSDSALFSAEALNAIVNCGNTVERVLLPRVEGMKILGGTAETPVFNPDFSQKAGDPSIEIEGFLLAGSAAHVGGAKIQAIEL